MIISDNIQNQYGKWIVVIPFTTEDIENVELFEVLVQNNKENGLNKISKLQLNNPRVIDRMRLKEYLGVLSNQRINELQQAWRIAFDSESWEW